MQESTPPGALATPCPIRRARGSSTAWTAQLRAYLRQQVLDGVHVPMGKAAESGYLKSNLERLKQAEGTDQATLLYNEYVVYDVRQVKAKYVVVVKLDFVS